MNTAREQVNMVLSESSISTSENFSSTQGETLPDTQALSVASPSWDAAWDSFMTELSSGNWYDGNPDDSEANLFMNPDLVFPSG